MLTAEKQTNIVRRAGRIPKLVRTSYHMGLGLFLVLATFTSILYTRAGGYMRASAAVPTTLNFQARLLGSSGAIVQDDGYSIEFNLYTASSGGSSVWNETQANVPVKSGYLSVYLGSVNNTLDSLDWSQQYWLTMNVNGDGEMNPRLRLTSVPYAFRSSQADGLTDGANVLGADDFAQLTPSNVQAVNSALAALRIDQQGVGLLAQFQSGGSDVFTIGNNGDVTSEGNATFAGGTLNLGDATQAGGLVLSDGSGDTATLSTASLTASRTFTLPDQSGTVCVSTGNCGGTGDISQNGNTLGVDITIGTNDTYNLNFETDGVTRMTIDTNGNANLTGALTLGTGLTVTSGGAAITGNSTITGTLTGLAGLTSSGAIQFSGLGAGLVQANGSGVLSSSAVDRNSATFFANALNVASGGTGAATFATNGVIFGNGTGALQAATAGTSGQVLIADTSGVPTFRTITGDGTISDTGVLSITSVANNSVVLGTDTTGDYVQNLGTLTGLSVTGNSGEGSTPALSVIYGDQANEAVQGNTQLTVSGGIGLSATNGVITLGAGGTVTLDLDNTTVSAGSYGLADSVAQFTVDSQGRLTAAGNVAIGNLANNALQNSSINLNYGTNLSGDASVSLGGTLNINFSATPTFTTVNTGALNTTGALNFNSFGGSAGVLQVDGSGDVSVAPLSGFEVPLTFDNGLTRTGNTVTLGGNLTGLTTIGLSSNNFVFGGTGNVGIGTNASPGARLQINTGADANVGLILRQNSATQSGDLLRLQTSAGGYMGAIQGDGVLNLGPVNGVSQIAGTSTFGDKIALFTHASFGRYGFGIQSGALVAHVGASTGAFAVRVDPGTGAASSSGTNAFAVSGLGVGVFAGTLAVNGNALSSSSSGFTLLASPTTVSAFGAATTLGLGTSAGTTTINGNTLTSSTFTFGAAGASTIQAANNQGLTVRSQGSGGLTLTSADGTISLGSDTLQRAAASLTIDVANAGLSTLHIGNSNGSNVANVDISGGLLVGTNNALTVDTNGNLLAAFTLLNGSSNATNNSGLLGAAGTSLNLGSAANFDVGNYVLINGNYAKITNKAGNTLTLSPAIVWSSGNTATEYRIPEIGGTNGSQPVANRFGRGYFLTGIVTGNATTYYNEDGISTNLSTFNIANENTATVNIGGAATEINIGTSGTNVMVSGSLETSPTETITAGGGLTVSSGGADITGGVNNNGDGITNAGAIGGVAGLIFTSGSLNLASGGITNTGSIAGVTTISASGAITAATSTNTINNLVINNGALSSVTGITFSSGSLNLASGGITNAGSIAGTTTLALSGAISGATTTNTINGLIINAGALSGITGATFTSGGLNLNSGGITNTGSIAGATTITASGAITAATSTNTINGLVIASGALTSVTGITFTSGNLAMGSGNISGAGSIGGTSLSVSGSITANTSNTINGLSVSSGSLSGITGFSQTSGTFSVTGSGAVTLGGGSNALTINSTAFDVSSAGALSGITTIGLSGAITGATATNTINGLIINAGSLSGITGFSQASGSFTLAGTVNVNNNAGANATNIATGTTTGTVTIGGGTSPLVINSTGFDVTAAGAVTASSTISASLYRVGATNGVSRTCSNTQFINGQNVTNGITVATNGCTAPLLSDQRLKQSVAALDDSILEKIKQVSTVNFDFDCSKDLFTTGGVTCDSDRQTGVIAQEIAQIFPDLVYQNSQGYYEVRYQGLSIYTLKGVQQIADKIEHIEQSLDTNEVKTSSVLRLDQNGALQNITGLTMSGGGASVVGGIDNNNGGLTKTGSITGATSVTAQKLTLNSTGTQDLLSLRKNGQGVFTVFHNGALELKLDATNAFTVKDTDGNDYFSVNTDGGLVNVGSALADSSVVLFVLDSVDAENDPPGVNGAQYYNARTNKFRCYQNDRWQDCLPAAATEYVLSAQTHSWSQGAGEIEIVEQPRTWIDFTNASAIRLQMQVSTPGTSGANCRLQYAEDLEADEWADLTTGDGIIIDAAGAVRGEWLPINADSDKEVLVRMLCRSTTLEASHPVVSNIRIQIR